MALAAASAPTLLAIVLLLVAVWADGAFALKSWGPLAVFVLIALAVLPRNGVRGAAALSAAAMFAFAVWTLISVTWAGSPSRATEGAGRALLYAGLFALPILTLPSARAAGITARALTAGAAVIVAGTLYGCATSGASWFLAGRLDGPIGYRNGTAALFAFTAWVLLCLAAQRRAHVLVRAGSFALAVSALGLSFLTQSRGVVLGFALGAVVALALGPDRIRRAWVAIGAIGIVAVASSALLDPYDTFLAVGRGTSEAAVDHAVGALLLATGASFAIALVLALFDGGTRLSERRATQARRAAGALLAVVVLIAVAGGLAAAGDPVGYVREKAHEFKQLDAAAAGQTRLGYAGGQRYDLWRIAIDELRANPVTGVGESSYGVDYFRRRATDRNLTDPHSLPLRVLAELGVIGALLLAAAFAAAGVALARGWRAADPDRRRWASAMAAGGTVVLGQSLVDWLWLIPGLTGLGLMCLGTAVALIAVPAELPPRRRLGGLARAIPVVCAVLVVLLYASDLQTRIARSDEPAPRRLDAAHEAQRLNPYALAPRYLQAGALEELGRRAQARAELQDALDREPRNFVTLGLLGDLETRAGRTAAAKAYYRRALALNPLDVGLQQLARRP